MLKVVNLSKAFGDSKILDGAHFAAHAGALTIVEGQNGAGKSTLFNIIAGLMSEDEGEVVLGKLNLAAMPATKRALHVAILRQDPKTSTVASFSVLDNFALALLKGKRTGLKKAASASVKERVESHLQNLGQDAFCRDLERPMCDFSGGQRQILAFAMATIHRPQLLLLDEPTAALDDKSSHQLMQLVKQLVNSWQIPAVMISHNHALNQQYGDAIYVLANRKLTATVEPRG